MQRTRSEKQYRLTRPRELNWLLPILIGSSPTQYHGLVRGSVFFALSFCCQLSWQPSHYLYYGVALIES